MLKFVLFKIKEYVKNDGSKYYQAIVLDDDMNKLKIYVSTENVEKLRKYVGKEITDIVEMQYKLIDGNEYYRVTIRKDI